MDMDDKKGKFQISRTTKLVFALVVTTILGVSASLMIFSQELAPEESRVMNQVNRFNASMRHIYKISNLNYKAFDALLEGFITKDDQRLTDSLDYLSASIGFIYAGYIENGALVKQVVPQIRESIKLIDQYGLSLEVADIAKIRDNFNDTFHELTGIEKELYVAIQQLYDREQQLQKKWQLFYILLIFSAFLGMMAIAFLSYRQNKLILHLENKEKSLREEMQVRRKAEDEKKMLAIELHQARKMESIGLMAGGVAHDLNNILAGIVGYPELLLLQLDKDSNLRKPLEAIHDSGTRAAQIVDDLLTIAKGAAMVKELRDLNSLVDEYFSSPESADLQRQYPRVHFKLHLAEQALPIFCSAVHVKKCLMNLVTNAAEAIDDSGEVLVSTILSPAHSGDDADMALLYVKDTGSGIAEEDLDHIFDPFYSKKHLGRSGTGLGLTIVWNTMNDHDGSAEVACNSHGTRFTLTFPTRGQEDTEAVLLESGDKDYSGNGEHILVVDDEEYLRDICCRMLTDLGYLASCVSSGEEALTFLATTRVDLVVLDMLMDPGMNGRQTFEEITRHYPGQKAIIVSGFSESEDVKAALKRGASSFIKKPYSMTDLGVALKKSLSG